MAEPNWWDFPLLVEGEPAAPTGQPAQAVVSEPAKPAKKKVSVPQPKAPPVPTIGGMSPKESAEFDAFVSGTGPLPPSRVQYFERRLGIAIGPYLGFHQESKLDYYRDQAESWATVNLDKDPSTMKPTKNVLLLQKAQAGAGPDASREEVARLFSSTLVEGKAEGERDKWGQADPAKSKRERVEREIAARSPFGLGGVPEETMEAWEAAGIVEKNKVYLDYEDASEKAKTKGKESPPQPLGYDAWKETQAIAIGRVGKTEGEKEEEERRALAAQEPVSPGEFDRHIENSRRVGDEIEFQALRFGQQQARKNLPRKELEELVQEERERLYMEAYGKSLKDGTVPPAPVSIDFREAAEAHRLSLSRGRDIDISYDEKRDRLVYTEADPEMVHLPEDVVGEKLSKIPIPKRVAEGGGPPGLIQSARRAGTYALSGEMEGDFRGIVNTVKLFTPSHPLREQTPEVRQIWSEIYNDAAPAKQKRMVDDPVWGLGLVGKKQKLLSRQGVEGTESLEAAQRAMIAGKDVRIELDMDGEPNVAALQNDLQLWYTHTLVEKKYGKGFDFALGQGEDWNALPAEDQKKIVDQATRMAGRDLASAMARGTGMTWVDPDPWASTKWLADLPTPIGLPLAMLMPRPAISIAPEEYTGEQPDLNYTTPRALDIEKRSALDAFNRMFLTTGMSGITKHLREELKGMSDEEYERFTSSGLIPETKEGNTFGIGSPNLTEGIVAPVVRLSETAIKSIDVALGITDDDPLSRQRRILRVREGRFLAEEYGDLFGDLADALEVEDPESRDWYVRAGLLGGFALEFTSLGSAWVEAPIMGIKKSYDAAQKVWRARNSAARMMPRLAAQIRQGKITSTEAFDILMKHHPYHAKMAEMRAAAAAKLHKDYMKSQDQLAYLAKQRWREAEKLAEEAGIIHRTSPAVLPGHDYASKIDQEIWIAERAREFRAAGKSRSVAKQMATEEFLEDVAKKTDEVNASTRPFDLYKRYEATTGGVVTERFYLRWQGLDGETQWYKWFERGDDGALKFAGELSLGGKAIREGGLGLHTRDGRVFYFNANKVGESAEAPLGAIRSNEALTFEGDIGQFLQQSKAVEWHGTARPGAKEPKEIWFDETGQPVLIPRVEDPGVLPRATDIWHDVYEPGAKVGFVEVPPRKVKQLQKRKGDKLKRFRTTGRRPEDLKQAVVEVPVPREVPAPVGAEPPPPKTLGEQVHLANKYHTARAKMLKAQLESAELRAVKAREVAKDFDNIDGPIQQEFREQLRIVKQVEDEIAKIEEQMAKLMPDVEKTTGELAASTIRMQRATEKLTKAAEDVQKVQNFKVSPKKAAKKKELLEELKTREEAAKGQFELFSFQGEQITTKAHLIKARWDMLLNLHAQKQAVKVAVEESLYGISNVLRAYRKGLQSDPRLRRLISAARKAKDPKKKAQILEEYAKIRMEINAKGLKGQPVQPGLVTHMPEWYQKSTKQMSLALRGAAREAEMQAMSVQRAYNNASKMAKKTGEGWDSGRIRAAANKKAVAEFEGKRGRAFEKALDSLTNDIVVGQPLLEDIPGISEKFVDVLKGSTIKKPPSQGGFLRRLLRRTVPLDETAEYTISPQKLLDELEQAWGKETIDHVTEKISPVEGAKGTRGGIASDILLRIKEAIKTGSDEFTLSLDEVSELQDINLALTRSWLDSHAKAREIGVVLALKRAQDDVTATFKSFDSTETWLSKQAREAFAAFNPIRAELGEVAAGVEDTLRAVRNYHDHMASELFNLSRAAEKNWQKTRKARGVEGEKGAEVFAHLDKNEYQMQVLFDWADGNAPMSMGLRMPIVPGIARPELARTTWANLGDSSVWQQMRKQIINDPRVLTEYEKMKKFQTFLDRSRTSLTELTDVARQHGDWAKILAKEEDEAFRVIMKETMDDWIKGGKKGDPFDEAKLVLRKYGDDPFLGLARDRDNGVVWALSRSLLPRGKTYSKHVDALMYTKTVELLRGSAGSTMKSFHQELSGVYTGASLSKFERRRYKFSGFTASDVSDVRSVGMIAMAAGHGAIMHRANRLMTKAVGGFMTADEVIAANKIIGAAEWHLLSPDAIDQGIAALNKLGRPFTQKYVGAASRAKNATKKWAELVQTGTDSAGRHYMMTRTLSEAIDSTMPNIIKELSEQANRFRNVDTTKVGNMAAAVDALSAWRASVVTGLAVPRPGYLINNFYGDFSQIWLAEGFGQATHTSLEFIMGIPWWSRRLVEGRSYMAQKLGVEMDSVLPDLTTSVFNPHINKIFMGKPGHFRTKAGRVVNNKKHLQGSMERGIFDTFVHEETLKNFTRGAEKHPFARTLTEKIFNKDWTRDISEMASFVQQRQRFALYTNLVAKGYTEAEAARRTLNALYDWKNSISEWEARLMIHYVPFYRFWRLALKQSFNALTEPIVRPSKEMFKKAITGRTGAARIHQQQVFNNNLHPFVDPKILRDYEEGQEQLDAAVPYLLPHWKGEGRAVWDITRKDPEERQYYEHLRGMGTSITHSFSATGPFTAMDSASLMSSWLSGMAGVLFTAAPWDFVGKEDVGAVLADDWEKNVFDHSLNLLFPHQKSMIQSAVTPLGVESGGRQYGMVRASGAELWLAKHGNGHLLSLSPDDIKRADDGKPMVPLYKVLPYRVAPVMLEFNALFKSAIFENPDLLNSAGGVEFLKGARFFAGRHMNVDQKYPVSAPEGAAAAVKARARTVKEGLDEIAAPMKQERKDVGKRINTPQEAHQEAKQLEKIRVQDEERYGPSEYPIMRPEPKEEESEPAPSEERWWE